MKEVLYALEKFPWADKVREQLSSHPDINLDSVTHISEFYERLHSAVVYDLIVVDPHISFPRSATENTSRILGVTSIVENYRRKNEECKFIAFSDTLTPQGVIDLVFEHNVDDVLVDIEDYALVADRISGVLFQQNQDDTTS